MEKCQSVFLYSCYRAPDGEQVLTQSNDFTVITMLFRWQQPPYPWLMLF